MSSMSSIRSFCQPLRLENTQTGGFVDRSGPLLKLTVFHFCLNAQLATDTFEKVITICSPLLPTSDGDNQHCFLIYLSALSVLAS